MARRIWNLNEIIAVAERYPQEGPKPLSLLLGRSEDAVTSLARRFGVRSTQRRVKQGETRALLSPSVNCHFFDGPSRDVAYVLGCLWSWGSVKTNTRHVLRLRCPLDRKPVLQAALDLMGSRHTEQRGRRRVLVEVGNSDLVNSLVKNYGRPPDRMVADPPFPTIPKSFMPDFARGLMDAAGHSDHRQLVWSGSPKVIEGLRDAIEDATGVNPNGETVGSKRVVSYRGPLALMKLNRWLPASRV